MYPGSDKNTVDNFNLNIEEKEFIAFVGPSGCGKSTTLRMIAGFEEITGGELYIDGKKVNEMAPRDRGISMVFQNYALYPHMTDRKSTRLNSITSNENTTMGQTLAVITLVTIPVIIIYSLFSKQIVEGVTSTGSKEG